MDTVKNILMAAFSMPLQTKNSMEQVSAPLPLTKEAIISLNNGSVSFEEARALFNVDLKTFKAKLLQEHIFVWNEVKYGPVRIHGISDYLINIVFKEIQKWCVVEATDSFEDVISILEEELTLSPGCYKLTYKHPSFGNVWIKIDRDWHYAVELSKIRGGFLRLYLEIFPSGQTADEGQNLMQQVSVPLPLRKEAILSLNNFSMTFEQARALFNVDLKTFKAKLLQKNILVWNEFKFGPVRIHGGDYSVNIIIKKLHKGYSVQSTNSFKEIISKIEGDLRLSPGGYKLTYKHPNAYVGNFWVKTDRDWHYAVELSKVMGYYVYLELEIFGQTADEDASDEDTSDEDASDEDA